MKAVKKMWCADDRIKLSEVLPITTPIAIGVEASSYCNFKCNYCAHGAEKKNFEQTFLDLTDFKNAIDSLKKFPKKVKSITFAANGEPITNPLLPEMIAYVRETQAADQITVFTNGSLLVPELSEKLIKSGLNMLRVSIQGVNDEKYTEICGVSNVFDTIVNNLTYFYEHKGNCKMFIKIVDKGLDNAEDEEKFYNIFGNICDQIDIEKVVPIRHEVNYDENICDIDNKNMLNQAILKGDICPQPFYTVYIRANSNVTACCITPATELVLGNIHTDSLYDIWNSDILLEFSKQQLERKRFENPTCLNCVWPIYGAQTNDDLEESAEKLHKAILDYQNLPNTLIGGGGGQKAHW